MFKSLPIPGKIALAFCGGVAAVMLVQNDIAPYRAQVSEEETQKSEEQKEERTRRRTRRPRAENKEKVATPQPPAIAQKPAGWECDISDDCPGYATLCTERHKCEQLKEVVCTCSQPDVVQCVDVNERARHTFCAKGCEQVLDGNKQSVGAKCR